MLDAIKRRREKISIWWGVFKVVNVRPDGRVVLKCVRDKK
jgi:hypothetical protein